MSNFPPKFISNMDKKDIPRITIASKVSGIKITTKYPTFDGNGTPVKGVGVYLLGESQDQADLWIAFNNIAEESNEED